MLGFTCAVFFEVLNISDFSNLDFYSQKIRFLSFVVKEDTLEGEGRGGEEQTFLP